MRASSSPVLPLRRWPKSRPPNRGVPIQEARRWLLPIPAWDRQAGTSVRERRRGGRPSKDSPAPTTSGVLPCESFHPMAQPYRQRACPQYRPCSVTLALVGFRLRRKPRIVFGRSARGEPRAVCECRTSPLDHAVPSGRRAHRRRTRVGALGSERPATGPPRRSPHRTAAKSTGGAPRARIPTSD